MLIFMQFLPITLLGTALVVRPAQDPVGSAACGKADRMAGFTDLVKNDGRKFKGLERRASPRHAVSAAPACNGARPGDGIEARLINISRHGILFETAERLSPEGTAYVRLISADAVFMLRGRILRSSPSLLRNSNTIYESAIEFDEEIPRSVRTGHGAGAQGQADPPRPGTKSGADGACAPAPICLIRAVVPRTGPDLNQIFGLNTW
jgi:hypothetical protein